jgi:hypothetical protein
MNYWESLFTQIHQQQGILIKEQLANNFNPIYVVTNVTGLYRDLSQKPVLIPRSVPNKLPYRRHHNQGKPSTLIQNSEFRYPGVIYTIEILLVITGFDSQRM